MRNDVRSTLRSAGILLALFVTPLAAGDGAGPVYEPGVDGVTAPQVRPHTQVSPAYPPAALSHGFDATVVVAVLVEPDGTVGDSAVLHSDREGYGFEAAAEEAVRQWRYRPARKEGRRVASYGTVVLRFQAPPEALRREAAAGFSDLTTTSHLAGRRGTVGRAVMLSLPGLAGGDGTGFGGSATREAMRPTMISAVGAFRGSEVAPGVHDRRLVDLSGVTVVGVPRSREGIAPSRDGTLSAAGRSR